MTKSEKAFFIAYIAVSGMFAALIMWAMMIIIAVVG